MAHCTGGTATLQPRPLPQEMEGRPDARQDSYADGSGAGSFHRPTFRNNSEKGKRGISSSMRLRGGNVSQRQLAMAPIDEFAEGDEVPREREDRLKYLLLRVFGMPAMYANKYKYITTDQNDVSMDRQISQWYQIVIHPLSQFRKYWDLLLMILVLWNIIILPVRLSFFWNEDVTAVTGERQAMFWTVTDIIIDFLFLIDIVLNFNTGFVMPGQDQVLVMDRKRIGSNYLKGWFAVDLVSSIPLDLIVLGTATLETSADQLRRLPKVLRIIKLSKLLRLLRVTKMTRYFAKFDIFSNFSSFVLRTFKLFSIISLFCHWNACIQFLVSAADDFPANSWVDLAGIARDPPFQQYTWSLFKALSHMLCIGYGSPGSAPLLVGEAWITILSMASGALLFVTLVGIITTLLVQLDALDSAHKTQLAVLNQYMNMRSLPLDLRVRIRQYHEFKWSAGKFMSEKEVMGMLPAGLRTEIARHNTREILEKVPFFQGADEGFVNAIVTRLEPEVYLPGEHIITRGEIAEEMYFVKTGAVEISIDDAPVTVLGPGSYFGEIALLKKNLRTADVHVLEPSELFRLGRDDFEDMMILFPASKAYMNRIADARLAVLARQGNTQHADPAGQGRKAVAEVEKHRRASLDSDGRRRSLQEVVEHAGPRPGHVEGGWGESMLATVSRLERLLPGVQKEFDAARGGPAAAQSEGGPAEGGDLFAAMIADIKSKITHLGQLEASLARRASLLDMHQTHIARGRSGARGAGAAGRSSGAAGRDAGAGGRDSGERAEGPLSQLLGNGGRNAVHPEGKGE